MNIFGDYSKYYNLLYNDKDYQGEADFVDKLIKEYAPDTKTILDLGCGTGRHDFILAPKGYKLTGVDISETMLKMARDYQHHANVLKNLTITPPEFKHDDIRSFNLDKQFDAVISLFHVMSYQTTNKDLKATLSTVQKHLKTGGVFIFDFWYGPAVLSERPSIQEKHLENTELKVSRLAEPKIHPNKNIVDVNYTISIKYPNRQIQKFKELHKMRYLFYPELTSFLTEVNLEICEFGEWLTSKTPGFDTWNVYCVTKKI